jgi:hypothetical protein
MHCLAPNCNGDGTGCDNMTCMIVTFKPYKSNILTTNNSVNSIVEETSIKINNGSSLKRLFEANEEDLSNTDKKIKINGQEDA